MFGAYRAIRMLGEGPTGIVHEATDKRGRPFALKVLRVTSPDRAGLESRVAREKRTLAKLLHPNLAETFSVEVSDAGAPFFVTELVSGHSLRDEIARGACSDIIAVDFAIDLVDALSHCHEHGVAHRNVKPENVRVHRGANGRLVTKLVDLGVVGLSASLGGPLPSLRYAAPESLFGMPPHPLADLYAAALVTYELLAGQLPFASAGDDTALAHARAKSEVPIVAEASDGMTALLARALARDPSKRHPDAHALSEDLRRLRRALRASPPKARPVGVTSVERLVAAQSPESPETLPSPGAPRSAEGRVDIVPVVSMKISAQRPEQAPKAKLRRSVALLLVVSMTVALATAALAAARFLR